MQNLPSVLLIFLTHLAFSFSDKVIDSSLIVSSLKISALGFCTHNADDVQKSIQIVFITWSCSVVCIPTDLAAGLAWLFPSVKDLFKGFPLLSISYWPAAHIQLIKQKSREALPTVLQPNASQNTITKAP